MSRPGWVDTPTAARQRAYRLRVREGGPIGARPVAFSPSARPLVPTDPAVHRELEALWDVRFRQVMAGWLAGQRSQHTRRAYAQAWRAWCTWCAEAPGGIDPVEPPAGAGGMWASSMEVAGLAPATRRLRMSAVQQILVELTLEGLRQGGDIFARVPSPIVPDVSSLVPLTSEQMARIVGASRQMLGRFEAAVLLGAVCGLRAMEIGQVCDGVLDVLDGVQVASVVRKGGRRGLVPVPQVVLDAARRDRWPREHGDISRDADRVAYLVGRVGKAAGVKLTPHQLRHWHVTAALGAGVPLERVQDSVGHSDPRTTQRYNRARVVVDGHSAFIVAGLVGV